MRPEAAEKPEKRVGFAPALGAIEEMEEGDEEEDEDDEVKTLAGAAGGADDGDEGAEDEEVGGESVRHWLQQLESGKAIS